MSLNDEQCAVLVRLLALTQGEELDCDEYADRLAAYVEGAYAGDDPAKVKLRALMEHHQKICPECEEELLALRRGLGL